MIPIPFDHHAARLLAACGCVCERHEADWHDDGDSENGPHLSGHAACTAWTRTDGGTEHNIIVQRGCIVDAFNAPAPPPGWFGPENDDHKGSAS